MVEIKTQWVSQDVLNKRTYGTGNKKKYIVIHQTGNTGRGANAQAHANIQSRLNPRQASWHFQVDDKEAIQSIGAQYHCWHAGVGRATGNLDSIGIEMCINSDGDYLKALKNTAELTKWLMDEYNIPLSRVTQHNDWDGKNCPAQIRAGLHGVTWNGFLNMVQGNKPKVEVKGAIKVKEPVKQKGEYTGNSIVDYLASIGMKSDFNTRKELAKEYGVANYSGTASQNTRLLELMREGATAKKVDKVSRPATISGAKLVKNENAYFLATEDIKVRNAPSTSATHTGTLPKGASINYKRVFEGNGYRWLEYTGNSGNTLYLPYRPIGDKKSWGTFHSERPSSKPKKTVDQMAREVIAGKHGQGHENRRKSLGISQSEYEKVRKRVNELA